VRASASQSRFRKRAKFPIESRITNIVLTKHKRGGRPLSCQALKLPKDSARPAATVRAQERDRLHARRVCGQIRANSTRDG